MVSQAILHALDMISLQAWDDAKAALEQTDDPCADRLLLLVSEMQQREQAQNRNMSLIRHEIGNALSVAQANVEGIIDGVLPQTAERLTGIHQALVTAGALLDDIRRTQHSSPLETIRLETFNVCALIAAQYATIAGLAEAKNVNVVYEPCGREYPSCTYFRGDPMRTGQILRNVLINAVRYTPPGGRVELVCDRSGGELTVVVRDTGPGIQPTEEERIFEAGYRGSNVSGEGSGLGLNVVSNLLRVLGGNARVVEQGRSGATFAIALPAVPLRA